MKLSIKLFIFSMFLLFISCENNDNSAPENNSFSYLEMNSTSKPKDDTVSTIPTDYTNLICLKKHSELKGNLIIKDLDFFNSNRSTNQLTILELSQPFILECQDGKKISANQVILYFEEAKNIEQYLGNMVLAIGEVSQSSSTNNKFPLQMNVIRLQPI